jgi:hypothetical protein
MFAARHATSQSERLAEPVYSGAIAQKYAAAQCARG